MASRILLIVLPILACARSTAFPPGWNGLASTPPLGWRSWNAYGASVSADKMTTCMDALTSKQWTVEGKANVSLADVGYATAGIDEGWEGCGQGVNGTQHDAQGNPVINAKFPDMAGLVKYGHDRGLKVGWYENGCACGERHELDVNYGGDVRQLHAFGFDGVKLDGCGAQRNMTKYADLMQKTGKAYLIENCHWGRCTAGDDSSCPTADWCPFNWYRTSGDINASPMSWYHNLQTTIPFQSLTAPLSRPGCWAYPDMLEVGRIQVDGQLHLGWNRAHFGAWCVVSAPLILGLDLAQQDALAAIVPVITNAEAIAVNQAWAGHPGQLVWSGLGGALGFPAARACDVTDPALKQSGWSLLPRPADNTTALRAPGGGCLRVQGRGYPGGAGGLVVVACNASDAAQAFEYSEDTLQLKQPSSGHCVDVHSGGPIVWMYGCSSGPNDQLRFNGTDGSLRVAQGAADVCFGLEAADPAGATVESSLQAWAKPLPSSRGVALLLINPDSKAHVFDVPLARLPLTGGGVNVTGKPLSVRDIWARADGTPIAAGTASVKLSVPALDSAFLRLAPTATS